MRGVAERPIGDAGGFVDHAAAVLGIALDPAVREAVVANFKAFAGLAAAIEGHGEPKTHEPPAVFRP